MSGGPIASPNAAIVYRIRIGVDERASITVDVVDGTRIVDRHTMTCEGNEATAVSMAIAAIMAFTQFRSRAVVLPLDNGRRFGA